MKRALLFVLFSLFSSSAFPQFSPLVEKVTADKDNFRYQETIVTVERLAVMRGTLWLPVGQSKVSPPYKLAIANHGSQDKRSHFPKSDPGYSGFVAGLLKMGMAVLTPYRTGFSAGELPRSLVSPESTEPVSCDVDSSQGLESAVTDVKTYLKVVLGRKDISSEGILLAGLSRGSMVALKMAADGYPNISISGVVNVSGGWLSEGAFGGQPWCGAVVNENFFREFGEKITSPIFSIYGDNDRYYSVDHIKRNLAYLGKKAPAEYVIVGGSGHWITFNDSNRATIIAQRTAFLQRIGAIP